MITKPCISIHFLKNLVLYIYQELYNYQAGQSTVYYFEKIKNFFHFLTVFSCSNLNQPNIVMFITDDQDNFLDGMEPMVKTKSWFGSGQKFTNAFVSTPVCCPSRSSVLTGLYQHNTMVVNNSLAGIYTQCGKTRNSVSLGKKIS